MKRNPTCSLDSQIIMSNSLGRSSGCVGLHDAAICETLTALPDLTVIWSYFLESGCVWQVCSPFFSSPPLCTVEADWALPVLCFQSTQHNDLSLMWEVSYVKLSILFPPPTPGHIPQWGCFSYSHSDISSPHEFQFLVMTHCVHLGRGGAVQTAAWELV